MVLPSQAVQFCARFQVSAPIIQAPMAGASTTAMAAAAAKAGTLSSIAAAYITPEALRAALRTLRKQCGDTTACNVNLFVPSSPQYAATFELDESDISVGVTNVNAIAADGQSGVTMTPEECKTLIETTLATEVRQFHEKCIAAFEEHPSALSFVFGVPDAAIIHDAKRRGIATVGTATTVEEADALLAAGVEIIVAQGIEAGGHRGTFSVPALNEKPPDGLSALDLATTILQELGDVPVVLAGGVRSPQDSVLALQKGVAAVQLGTPLLLAEESAISQPYRAALNLHRAKGFKTVFTRIFSGRWAQGISNDATDLGEKCEMILPFPLQNSITAETRRRSTSPQGISLWCGRRASSCLKESTTSDILEAYTTAIERSFETRVEVE